MYKYKKDWLSADYILYIHISINTVICPKWIWQCGYDPLVDDGLCFKWSDSLFTSVMDLIVYLFIVC